MSKIGHASFFISFAVTLLLISCNPSSPTTGELPVTTLPTSSPFSPSLDSLHSLIQVQPATISLSSQWQFAVDPQNIGKIQGWALPGWDALDWKVIDVPHTWNVMPEYFDYQGLAWYRKSFLLPADACNARLSLHFEGIFYLAEIWFNGVFLGQHEGGYTSFDFEISDLAKSGAQNLLAVQVDNRRAMDRLPATLGPTWSYDWWNYGGIVRQVSIDISSYAYIVNQQIISIPHLISEDKADLATISTAVTIDNASSDALKGQLIADVLDDCTDSSVLASLLTSPIFLEPGQSTVVNLMGSISKPELWHFDHPHLYCLSTSLVRNGDQVLHTIQDTFGIRQIVLKDARFYLNGEAVRLVGLSRHADSPRFGLAETTTIMAADYDGLKQLNTVFSRPVHYPQSEFILDYCDRKGILLIPEIPAWQLNSAQLSDVHLLDLARQQLREMIMAGFNHPSVWAWSLGNEFESDSQAGRKYVKEMVALARSLDPTRPVGFASNRLGLQSNLAEEATQYANFVMMNQYFGTWQGPKNELSQAVDRIHAAWPDKPIIVSEFGFEPRWNSLSGILSGRLDPTEYYFITEDLPSNSEEADFQRRQLILDQLKVLRQKPFVIGAIFWTYQDYRTPSGFQMGVVDSRRNPRGSWKALRLEFSPVLIDSVVFSPAVENKRKTLIRLVTRGPFEDDMPVYKLRDYHLVWSVVTWDTEEVLTEGILLLPEMIPGTEFSGEINWDIPETEYLLQLKVVRPTGFSVVDRCLNSAGETLPCW
jgi:hypothetical protein